MWKQWTCAFAVAVLASCNGAGTGATTDANKVNAHDTGTPIIWRERLFDTSTGDTVSALIVNRRYLDQAPDQVKAAIGFVGTFIGSECDWDGQANDSMTDLSCKLIKALGWGYQCSSTHLGILRRWLRNETELLKELDDCPVIPYTASRQTTFDTMSVETNGDTITVRFKASGINMPMEKSWQWHGIYQFRSSGDELRLVRKEESEPQYSTFGE